MMQQLMQQEHTNQNDAAQPVRDEKRCWYYQLEKKNTWWRKLYNRLYKQNVKE
jgi:hypothetical protein